MRYITLLVTVGGGALYLLSAGGDGFEVFAGAFGLTAFFLGMMLISLRTAHRACLRLPVEWQRRILCEWFHVHAGPIEAHGPYAYIDCYRCGGLRQPMPHYYAEARYGERA